MSSLKALRRLLHSKQKSTMAWAFRTNSSSSVRGRLAVVHCMWRLTKYWISTHLTGHPLYTHTHIYTPWDPLSVWWGQHSPSSQGYWSLPWPQASSVLPTHSSGITHWGCSRSLGLESGEYLKRKGHTVTYAHVKQCRKVQTIVWSVLTPDI